MTVWRASTRNDVAVNGGGGRCYTIRGGEGVTAVLIEAEKREAENGR